MPLPLAADSAPHTSLPMVSRVWSDALVMSLFPNPAARTSLMNCCGPGCALVTAADGLGDAALWCAGWLPQPVKITAATAASAAGLIIGSPPLAMMTVRLCQHLAADVRNLRTIETKPFRKLAARERIARPDRRPQRILPSLLHAVHDLRSTNLRCGGGVPPLHDHPLQHAHADRQRRVGIK